jgi:hypothetical protein
MDISLHSTCKTDATFRYVRSDGLCGFPGRVYVLEPTHNYIHRVCYSSRREFKSLQERRRDAGCVRGWMGYGSPFWGGKGGYNATEEGGTEEEGISFNCNTSGEHWTVGRNGDGASAAQCMAPPPPVHGISLQLLPSLPSLPIVVI